jgi:ClpP class serine protease
MEFLNLFWIFLLIAFLVPLIRQRMLEACRLKMLHKLEETRGSRVIALIYRQEKLSFLGFPLTRYPEIQDPEQLLRAIQLTDSQTPVDLILHTPCGLDLAAEQIAHALSKHEGKVTVFIPHYAMSGGTIMALAADEVIMDENAVLGPVDPQIGEYPAASILKMIEQKKTSKVDDETLILADVSRKAIQQVKDIVRKIARATYTEKQAVVLAEELTSGKWTYDYPITVEEVLKLGIKVNTEMPQEIYQLMNLYPQSASRRPASITITTPYHFRGHSEADADKSKNK